MDATISSALVIRCAGMSAALVTIKGELKSENKSSGFNHAAQSERAKAL